MTRPARLARLHPSSDPRPSSGPRRRRTVAGLALAGGLALATAIGTPVAAQPLPDPAAGAEADPAAAEALHPNEEAVHGDAANAGFEEALGQPITGLTNAGAGYTEDAAGRDIGVVVAGGSPSVFSAVDIVTGERLMSQTIEGGTLTWAYATTPDRMIYIATSDGEVFRFDPDAVTLTQIAYRPFGERYFWQAEANADGEVFFGTYPGGKVLAYDPATDEWRDFGTVVPGNQYARSIAVDGDIVFVGGGTQPTLTRLDTSTGTVSHIDLPEGYADQEFVYDLSLSADHLFARLTPANETLVYSLAEQQWVDTIENTVGLEVSPAVRTLDSHTERTEVLIPLIGGGMVGYDIDTHERRTVSIDLGGGAARGWGFQEVDLDGFPGKSLITATSKAVFHIWSPETGQTRSQRSDAAPTPFLIRSLATGPDGDVYVGGYASPPGIAHVDAEAGASTLLPGPSQAEGMVAHDDYLVIGTYPGGLIYTYDTTQPWQNGTNPPPPLQIGHRQDRPVAWTSAGDLVAIGTVPDYGHLGGALTLFDPETGEMEVIPNLIADQTIISLTYHGGVIYGGTGIWGGLGVEPTTTEGHLFAFDLATRQLTSVQVPVPGEENVSGITIDPYGYLWGITANELFKVDLATMEVIQRQRYFDVDDSEAYVTGRDLFWHAGKLVGQTVGRVFEIDPDTLEMTVLQSGTNNLALDRFGNYYYSRGGDLFRWVPADAAPLCEQTIDGTYAGPLTVSTGITCVHGATINGPITIAAGAGVRIVNSVVSGPLTAVRAAGVTVRDSRINGPVRVDGTTGAVIISGSTINGPLSCHDNAEQPTDEGNPTTVTGPATGQCANL